MARPLRLEHAGALWHITSRGNERRDVFRDDQDRTQCLAVLAEVVEGFGWRLHAYVLMGNHYHLLLETPEPNLSRGMHRLNGTYTRRFNRRHGRVGHLYQGRFTSVLVEKERHLLELVRYVVLNPVRAGLVRSANQWRWSNFRATAGMIRSEPWLDVDWTLSQFGGGAQARTRYRRFVADGVRSGYNPWDKLAGQVFLGGEEFREKAQEMIDHVPRSHEIPRLQKKPARPALDQIIRVAADHFETEIRLLRQPRHTPFRLAVAHLARNDAGLRFTEFASVLGVRPWAASNLAGAAELLALQKPHFRSRIDRIRSAIHSSQT